MRLYIAYMKIKRLVIENFKSIERIELVEPNPFTVFVGPNGSGKSNIFEALEFVNISQQVPNAVSLFGGQDALTRRQNKVSQFSFLAEADTFGISHNNGMTTSHIEGPISVDPLIDRSLRNLDYRQFNEGFSRIFVRNNELVKLVFNDDQHLSLSAKNLEKVLKRILTEPILRNEIFEWLELFVPEFKSVEVVANPFSGEETLLWYEQYSEKPFTKDLISDGTYNILAMLTAVYQSDNKPQFLCIEEPENGLHPQVAGELIDFFRIMCEERGHHIWLNTHSQSMIARLKPEEMIVVEKKQGKTQTTQYQGRDFHGLRMDEALLMNVLGGGLPW